ncbi:HHIP-like protein 1 [Nymphon striatum]|nr:HHIP-like protein 1 [Nymphon striatum]
MNVLDANQEAAFERYIQSGGGYRWCARCNRYRVRLGHPAGTPEADFIIKDNSFIATKHFTDSVWHRADEIYNYKNINPDVNVLMTVDESTYEGGKNGDVHPFAWYHEFDGGRSFYTGAGHTDESYAEEAFLQHLLGGIQYAIDVDRFSKITLAEGKFFEPTEMTVLSNNDVLIGQRRGEVLRYNAETKEITEIAKFDVYHKTLNTPGVNAEEGLMGIQKDPNYDTNNWIYVYYSPTGDEEVNRLSRFKYTDGNFDMSSEQKIIDVYSQREICCHTGGSIAFGGDGLLYLSTECGIVNNGFAPLNDLPGKQQYDARRSSGNTNDLRGKIIRIRVNEDGSYDIPEGNLFAKGTEKTRPEIYTMGHRNPYRISVDSKRGYVYWGDVGPDARADQLDTRGPRGYDEMNQARKAGNFGWPLFIAGTGGRNAMAGPTYYSDEYTNGGGLPSYYDGKVIIYDWMRGWMMAVHLFEDGSFNKMEPFAS